MLPRLTLPVLALLALASCSAPQVDDGPLPAPLAGHQWHPAEAGFLNDLHELDTPRSMADLVRLGQAACGAVLEDRATRADLRPAITSWAQVGDGDADRLLTAASGNLCPSAVLADR